MNTPLDSGSMEGLRLNAEMLGYLRDSARWARFLAIVGFIFIGLMIIGALFMGAFMTQLGGYGASAGIGGFIVIGYLVLAVVYFFPILYLYRFGTSMRNAMSTHDNILLAESFSNLRKHYNFLGILTAIILVLYGVMILISVVSGVFSSF